MGAWNIENNILITKGWLQYRNWTWETTLALINMKPEGKEHGPIISKTGHYHRRPINPQGTGIYVFPRGA